MFESAGEGFGAPKEMADAELGAYVEHLCLLADQVEAARLAALSEWDARAVFAYDGAPNGATWLASRGRLGRAQAAGMVRTARQLRTMPATAAALAEGELAPAKVRLFARAINERTEAAFARDEEVLVAEASKLTVDQTATLIRFWVMRADPDGPDQPGCDDDTVYMSQTLRGRWDIDGDLDRECGAVVHSVLDRIGDQLREAAKRSGETPLTGARLRAAALVEMARRATAAADDKAGARPLIWVMANLEDLRGRDGMCDLVGSGPISAETARRMACDADVARVLMDGPSVVVDLGRTSRTASPTQHRLLALRDHGCVFPGCDRPPGWCKAHHLQHWTKFGPTDMDNLALLCSHHHHRVHEGGFGIHREQDGTFTFTRPDGTPLEEPPVAA